MIPLVAMPGISWADIIDRANLQSVDNNYFREKANFVQKIYQTLSSKKLQKHSSILDVSCGTGSYLVEFAKAGFNAIGIENDLELVANLVQKQKKEGVATKVYWRKDDEKIDLIAKIRIITFFDTAFNRFFLNADSIQIWFKRFTRMLMIPGVIILQLMPTAHLKDKKTFKILDGVNNDCDTSLSSVYSSANSSVLENILTYSIRTDEVALRTTKKIQMRLWDYREIEEILRFFGFKSIMRFDFNGKEQFIAGIYNSQNVL